MKGRVAKLFCEIIGVGQTSGELSPNLFAAFIIIGGGHASGAGFRFFSIKNIMQKAGVDFEHHRGYNLGTIPLAPAPWPC